MPLRAIYRRAIHRGEVTVNPTTDLQLPKVIGKRDRIASPAEAEALIEAPPWRIRRFGLLRCMPDFAEAN
jgi:site-specific recombinase XerD